MWIRAATALGVLLASLDASSGRLHAQQELLVPLLQGVSASGRIAASFIVSEYYLAGGPTPLPHTPLLAACQDSLGAIENGAMLLQETAFLRRTLLAQTRRLRQQLRRLPGADAASLAPLLAEESAKESVAAAGDGDDAVSDAMRLATGVYDALETDEDSRLLRDAVLATVGRLQHEYGALLSTVNAAAAEAIVSGRALPDKVNPVVKPLLKAVEKQTNEQLQERAAAGLARLIVACVPRKASPNTKLLRKRLMPASIETAAEATAADADQADQTDLNAARSVQRRGAEAVLKEVLRQLGRDAFDQLPVVWQAATQRLQRVVAAAAADDDVDGLFAELQLVSLLLRHSDEALRPRLASVLPGVFVCIQHEKALLRRCAAQCCTDFCRTMLVPSFEQVIRCVLPMLHYMDNDNARIGAAETLRRILDDLGVLIAAYLAFLVVPVLGRMSDPCPDVRKNSSLAFATAVRLMPLEAGVPNPDGMDAELVQRRVQERRFLEQLLDGSKTETVKVHPGVKAELRRYQQDGVNWLSFLQRFNLHGVLCDDMGLGKTLQCIAVLATDVNAKRGRFAETGLPDHRPLPSLVVCPSTLVHHWPYEIEKFCDDDVLRGYAYSGTPAERADLRKQILPRLGSDVLVMSYQVLRSDLEHFQHLHWNYCILDEGHVIKNWKSQVSMAVKRVHAQHRLVLSGTPIQNNVLDLWSLFDFLMPGYLGDHADFHRSFSKVISAGHSAKASSRDLEASALALEALHRQTLPFLLRRLKEDVLSDLPPKIIQDYHCDLSPLQLRLYESFSKSQVKMEALNDVDAAAASDAAGAGAGAMHIFQALQYLRKLCTHPALVLQEAHPQYADTMQALADADSDLYDLVHAPKLVALRQLLLDCGIGHSTASASASDTPASAAVGQHRVLVFAQLKSVLDLVEQTLFHRHMPSVTYLRMDGSVASADRFKVVRQFNDDPTIDVLLLTTHVGGLGLNLTGADTVIFLEHDWNPMQDLQAMDRAHRIGQKKVVTVYRLITRGTLEEKILSLQQFKMNVANTVVSADNSSLKTMGTSAVLDLLTVSSDRESAQRERRQQQQQQQQQPDVDAFGNAVMKDRSNKAAAKPGSARYVIENLQQLWDESQYDEEYDMSAFVQRLK